MSTFGAAVQKIASGARTCSSSYRAAAIILSEARFNGNTHISESDLKESLKFASSLSLQDGYKLQMEMENELVTKHGWKKYGFKVGATSRLIQEKLGIDHPFFGTIFKENIREQHLCEMASNFEVDDAQDAGVENWCSFGSISKTFHNCRGIEAEFAFTLRDDILPREDDYSWEEIAEHVESITPCIEICGSRFSAPIPPGNAPFVIADGAGNAAFLVCQKSGFGHLDVQSWIREDGSELQVETLIDFKQEEAIKGAGKQVLGHPIHSLTWLANELNHQHRSIEWISDYPWRRLEKGDFIATGATSGLMVINPGSQVVVDFKRLGALEMVMQD